VFGPLEGYPRSQELCHNCDTKPVFTVKTDFIDRTTLLILRNLLKTKVSPKIPAYEARPPFSTAYSVKDLLWPLDVPGSVPINRFASS